MSFQDKSFIEKIILNKTLANIEFFNVNDQYFEFDSERILIIDGGVEMIFGEDKISIGWSPDDEFHDTINSDIDSLLGELDYYKIDLPYNSIFKNFIGFKVPSIKLKLETIQQLDDEFEPNGNFEFIIKELILEFENSNTIQIAPISYDIDTEKRKLVKPTYNPQGEILISINNIIQIEDEYKKQQ